MKFVWMNTALVARRSEFNSHHQLQICTRSIAGDAAAL